jgi:hypothetical protein
MGHSRPVTGLHYLYLYLICLLKMYCVSVKDGSESVYNSDRRFERNLHNYTVMERNTTNDAKSEPG